MGRRATFDRLFPYFPFFTFFFEEIATESTPDGERSYKMRRIMQNKRELLVEHFHPAPQRLTCSLNKRARKTLVRYREASSVERNVHHREPCCASPSPCL